MDFDAYHDAVLEHAIAFGDASTVARAVRKPGHRPRRKKPAKSLLERPEARKLTAAAALVIAERGEAWAMANPISFRNATLKKLGTIASIAITVISFVTGTGGVWAMLARILIPAILSFLSSRSRPGIAGAPQRFLGSASPDDWSGLTETAQQILRGE